MTTKCPKPKMHTFLSCMVFIAGISLLILGSFVVINEKERGTSGTNDQEE